MGLTISRFLTLLFSNREYRILMVGLDAAGKTTVLYKLHLGELVTTIPTIGFNVEKVRYKNLTFTVWDIGGQERIRRLWKHYFAGSDAIIFVIDSNDRARIEEARNELKLLLEEDLLRDSVILVIANKQDMPHAMSAAEITDALSMPKNRQWLVQAACAVSGEGLPEGLDWLASQLQARAKK